MTIQKENCLVIDVDGTLCPLPRPGQSYDELEPFSEMVERLLEWKRAGFTVVLMTSRNMRTFGGNIGLINAHTARPLMNWLDRHGIPYDEIHFGKPWAGRRGYYVDDRAVRPAEFLAMDQEQLDALVARGRPDYRPAETAHGKEGGR